MNNNELDAATIAFNSQRKYYVERFGPDIHERYLNIFTRKYDRCDAEDLTDMELDLYYTLTSFPEADLEMLLKAPEEVFIHDIGGIKSHICRDAASPNFGKMMDCFLPKFVSLSRRATLQKAEVQG